MLLNQMGEPKNHINQFDAKKWNDNATNPIDQNIQSKYPVGRDWPVFHTFQCQRNEGNNNEGIKYDRT